MKGRRRRKGMEERDRLQNDRSLRNNPKIWEQGGIGGVSQQREVAGVGRREEQ